MQLNNGGDLMKRTLLGTAMLVGMIGGAQAADLGSAYKAPSMAAPAWSWTGFYIGGNLGGGMASSHFDDATGNFFGVSATPTRGFFTGGGQIGYNYQFGYGLLGIEADVNGNSSFKNSLLCTNCTTAMSVGIKADVSGTIRARAGLVMNNVLIYATGGAAWADIKQTGIEFNNDPGSRNFGVPTGTTANASGVRWGGVIGAGVEFAMSQNWSVGGEFLHTIYADHDASILDAKGASPCGDGTPSTCVIRGQLTTDVGRIRLNYKFAP
jgi:opacity protein-like surface antigen